MIFKFNSSFHSFLLKQRIFLNLFIYKLIVKNVRNREKKITYEIIWKIVVKKMKCLEGCQWDGLGYGIYIKRLFRNRCALVKRYYFRHLFRSRAVANWVFFQEKPIILVLTCSELPFNISTMGAFICIFTIFTFFHMEYSQKAEKRWEKEKKILISLYNKRKYPHFFSLHFKSAYLCLIIDKLREVAKKDNFFSGPPSGWPHFLGIFFRTSKKFFFIGPALTPPPHS